MLKSDFKRKGLGTRPCLSGGRREALMQSHPTPIAEWTEQDPKYELGWLNFHTLKQAKWSVVISQQRRGTFGL